MLHVSPPPVIVVAGRTVPGREHRFARPPETHIETGRERGEPVRPPLPMLDPAALNPQGAVSSLQHVVAVGLGDQSAIRGRLSRVRIEATRRFKGSRL